MSRNRSTAQKAAALQRHYQAIPLVEFHFDSGLLCVTLGPSTVNIDGKEYVSTGILAEIKPVKESVGSFEGLVFTMSGLDAAISEIVASEWYEGRLVLVKKLFLDKDTNQPIELPVTHWIGRIRTMTTSETNNTASVIITAEHYEAELQRPSPIRLNNADQQQLYPGDRGAEYVEQMAEKIIVWPSKEALKK